MKYPRTWMCDAPLVFVDPNDSCRPWITYTWSKISGVAGEDQGNIDAFPFRSGSHTSNYYLMDALYSNPKYSGQTKPLRLFYPWNNNNSIDGIPNGSIVVNASNQPMQWLGPTSDPVGNAEGSDLVYYNNRYYVFTSRNRWFMPSYQIVYRLSAAGETDIQDMHLPNPPDSQPENVLLASNWVQDVAGGRSNNVCTNYGHSQFFTAYGRPYIIFQKMLDTSQGQNGERRIFIKELNFNPTTGEIGRIWENYPYPNYDVNWFKAPTVGGGGVPVPY